MTTKGFIVQIDGDDYEGIYDCGDHYRVTLLPGHLAAIALANGYVKAEVPITSMHDPRLTAKKTEPWHIDIDSLARSAGYVKAEDYEALKAKVAELTDLLEDATSTLDQIEAESACFDGLARSAGYVKLEPGQVVVQTKDLTRIVTWFKGDARTVPHTDMDTTLNRFAAALDAIKEARDE